MECSIYRLVFEIDSMFILVQAKALTEKVHEVIRSEEKATRKFSYTVSGVLSSGGSSTSRSDNLRKLLEVTEKYSVYRFKTRQELVGLNLCFELFCFIDECKDHIWFQYLCWLFPVSRTLDYSPGTCLTCKVSYCYRNAFSLLLAVLFPSCGLGLYTSCVSGSHFHFN